MSIYIWSISLSTPDNIKMSLTTWISLMPISVNWLYRCFTYLGGSFIELTTHAFFILNIAKFKFEKMSKLTKLDWIFFFAGYYIRQRNLLVQTYIMNTEQTSKNIFTWISWSIPWRHSCFAIPFVKNIESNLVFHIACALIDLSPLIKVTTGIIWRNW